MLIIMTIKKTTDPYQNNIKLRCEREMWDSDFVYNYRIKEGSFDRKCLWHKTIDNTKEKEDDKLKA
jgi:hypothetical protein